MRAAAQGALKLAVRLSVQPEQAEEGVVPHETVPVHQRWKLGRHSEFTQLANQRWKLGRHSKSSLSLPIRHGNGWVAIHRVHSACQSEMEIGSPFKEFTQLANQRWKLGRHSQSSLSLPIRHGNWPGHHSNLSSLSLPLNV